MAAALLWVLDASINISMEPFRAFVADKLDVAQRTAGFVMQSLFIGIGASLANALPFVLGKMGVSGNTASGIPLSVKYSFQAGAVVFLLARAVDGLHDERVSARGHGGVRARAAASGAALARCSARSATAVREMPATMRQLAVVQLFTWLGLFCMWLFFVPATARHVFGATDPQSDALHAGHGVGRLRVRVLLDHLLRRRARAAEARRRHEPQDGARGRAHLRRRRPAVGLPDPRPVPAAPQHGRRRHRVGVDPLDAVRHPVDRAAGAPDGRLHGRLQLLHRHPRDHRVARLRPDDARSCSARTTRTRRSTS